MKMRSLIFFLVSCIVPLVATMNRFSTKSFYVFEPQIMQNYGDFVPIKVWGMVRHGTRYPSKKVISRYLGMEDLRNELLSKSVKLTDNQRLAFEKWKPMQITLDHQKYLTADGEQELFQLGSRFRQQYPMFFDGESQFTFKHTPTQRTEVSAKKFIEGILPESDQNSTVVAKDDPVLRPYKGCSLWRKTVKKNKQVSLKEKFKFEESSHVIDLVQNFREFTNIDHITIDDIAQIYTTCAFETSWKYNLFDGKSVWCSLFQNEEELRVMEYLEDLKYYWIDGHGFEITRKVACKTVEDILRHINPSNDDKSLSFYFTHSGTILKLLTFLELYKDNFDLTAENFSDDRLWKTSHIDTFASNIYVILYKSETHGPHIHLLHQEQIIDVPNCQTNKFRMCPFETFKNTYESKITNCKLQEICSVKDEL